MKLSLLLQCALKASSVAAIVLNNPLVQGVENVFQLPTHAKYPEDMDVNALISELKKNTKGLDNDSLGKLDSTWKQLVEDLGKEKVLQSLKNYEAKFSSQQGLTVKKGDDSVKEGNFQTMSDTRFQSYSLRIKKNHPEVLGLDTVDQYTGYLDVDDQDKHFFFWLFESRNDPKKDPVILWLNGGPGCSSATGLFFELGPLLVGEDLKPIYNPYSWNSNATVIFLDQPIGVGYSYGGDDISSTSAASKDVYVFLELFFQKFPHFLRNKFHIAGESYAGHYIPSIASEILSNADRSFRLSSLLIGNGITDSLIQYGSYGPMACGKGGYKQLISDEDCEKIDRDYPRCAALVKSCYNVPSPFTCVPAELFCESRLMGPFEKTGLNYYDIRTPCNGSGCYPQMSYVDQYLNLDYVKDAVGALNIEEFRGCDDKVFNNFILSGDGPKPFQQYVAEVLDYGIPVLIYAGDKDYICNWLGNKAWSDALDYSLHENYVIQPDLPWVTRDGYHAGEVKNFGRFTFLRIFDAGHMVPFNQAANSLDMVNRWVSGDYAFGN